jgi:hypothetical protein
VELSDTNQTNNFTASFTVLSPFGKPGSGGNKFVGVLAGGWSLNGILSLHSGLPYTVVSDIAILNNGGYNNERANLMGNAGSGAGSVAEWYNVSAFADPAPYTYGNSKPNAWVTDWGRNLDISLFSQFHLGLGESRYFEFRAEAYNVFNNIIFGYPNNNIDNVNAGQVTSAAPATLPRQLQMGLKFYLLRKLPSCFSSTSMPRTHTAALTSFRSREFRGYACGIPVCAAQTSSSRPCARFRFSASSALPCLARPRSQHPCLSSST